MGRPKPTRELFEDDLNEVWYANPRNRRFSSRVGKYLGDHLLRRPLSALHRLAVYSETALWKARRGRLNAASVQEVEFLFFEVRRLQKKALSACGKRGGRVLSKRMPQDLRDEIAALLDSARRVGRMTGLRMRLCMCPACGGRGKMGKETADIVRSLVRRAVDEGLLPKGFSY